MDYEDSSGESSSEGGEQLEIAEILGHQIPIPQGVAESSEIFNSIFSQATFNNLSAADKEHLMKFLPKFPENDAEEKQVTMERLFNRENFKFGSPFEQFYFKLQRGYFRPDIAQLHHLMKKAERRQYKDYMKRVCYSMLKNIIVSRRQLLEQALSSPPGPFKPQKQQYSSPSGDLVSQRVKKRYFQELAAFRSEVGELSQSSEDENYADRAPRTLSKKQRQKLQSLESDFSRLDMTMVTSTLATKPKGFDLENNITSTVNPYEITDEAYRKMLSAHKRKRATQDKSIKLSPSGGLLKELQARLAPGKRRLSMKSGGNSSPVLSHNKIRKKSSSNCSTPVPRIKSEPGINESAEPNFISKKLKYDFDSEIAKKTGDSTDEEIQGVLEPNELDKNIDVESASPTNIPQNQKLIENQAQQNAIEPVPGFVDHETLEDDLDTPFKHSRTTDLMQDTHACFFSLLRDIICSSPQHRMRLDRIENRLKVWESNPISPLNEWFSLIDESWFNLLDSALCFLSGEFPDELEPEDFVPYIEFKSNQKNYQWIGAGRDSDSHLLALCSHWLDHREEMSPPTTAATIVQPVAVPEVEPEVVEPEETEENDPQPIVSVIAVGEEPPPRWSTNWMVRPSTEEEKLEFQIQERERFQNPTKAFTYIMHGYESVVGPVKGINANQNAASVLKPRGHNLLSQNRPNYVTVLSLVRDAAARLPNGEGTRSDMCILLKDSQYLDLSTAGETTLQSVVSSALDRLHYEVDSCVRFDTKRKMWIYLHRNRTEKEMENMYYIYQGMSKGIKKPQRKKAIKKTDANGTPKEKEPRKPKNSQNAKIIALMKETEDAVCGLKDTKESQTVEKPVIAELAEPPKQEKRSVAQEIVTSSGKKILIQTTFAGRNPVKFVATPSTSKTTLVTKTVDATQVKPSSTDTTVPIFKSTAVTATSAVQATSTTPSFLMNNLAGTQFLTASGQKVQIISGSPQNLGQIPSIQLTKNIQSMLAKNVPAGGNAAATPSLLQNIQQVQIMTSSGQIIARTIPATGKNSLANLQVRSVTQLPANDESKTSVLKTAVANNIRTAVTAANQLPVAKAAITKNLKNIRINVPTTSAPMSLLTTNQPKQIDKDAEPKLKVAGIQVMQKPGTKVGAQILNVSHLLNKPMMPKNNAAVLTGVKLVNTQQGVKMVATSATTVVQTVIPTAKGTSTVAKSLQVPTSSDLSQIQAGNQQIISMEALVQGARNSSTNKGQTSLIQLTTTPGQPAQFAVVSQGSIQPRIIQAQIPGMIQTVASQQGGPQAKATLSNVRMATNVTLANMKPVILAKPQSQAQNVILTTDGSVGSQALVLTPHTGVRPATSGAVAVMQPGGSQQINLPFGYKGLKVLPIGGPKVYARFVKNPTTQPVEVPKSEEQ